MVGIPCHSYHISTVVKNLTTVSLSARNAMKIRRFTEFDSTNNTENDPNHGQDFIFTGEHGSKVETYRTDAILLRTYKPKCAGTISKRGKIKIRPSKRSLNRLVFLLNNCDTPMESMLTITMPLQLSKKNSVDFHNRTLKAALEKLRREGVKQWAWVREFQTNGSVHWHIFTDLKVASPGSTDVGHSKRWSNWMANRYLRDGWSNEKHRINMISDSHDGFVGCCRWEQLMGDIGGRYAGKEGSKRFQKIAPKRWRDKGGAWWRCSRNVKCTPTGVKHVDGEQLECATIDIAGEKREIPYRIQFNKGTPQKSQDDIPTT